MRDLRICALGDSFVAGVGDPEHRGWVGLLAAGTPMTLYNLGVRRDTTRDVLTRWRRELPPRLRMPGAEPVDARVVVSVGVNDTTPVPGTRGPSTRVGPAASAAHLDTLLGELGDQGWSLLVVGPPQVPGAEQNERIADLSGRYGDVCAGAGVAWVPVIDALLRDDVWTAEVAAGDGAHPGAGGYRRLAALVEPAWRDWLG